MDATATPTTTFTAMKTAAIERWREWAESLSRHGSPPPPLDVLEAGAVLGIPSPMDALERDAEALGTVRHMEDSVARGRAVIAERRAADGGPAGVREKLSAARAEVRRLEKLSGLDPRAIQIEATASEAQALRRKHARAFPAASKTPCRKKGTRRALS